MAAAAWSPSVTVSESGTRYGFGQDVGPDGTGLMVWSAPLPGDEGYSISAREVGVDGQPGTRVTVSGAAPGAAYTSAYAPAVRYDAAGTATVVWLESTYSSDSCFAESGEQEAECVLDEYVRARQIDAGGSLSPVRELQHRQTVLPDEGSFGGTSPAYVTYGQPVIAGGPAATLTVLWPESTFVSGCAAYGYSRSYVDSECEADQRIKWVRLSAAGLPQGAPQPAFESHTSGYGSGEPLLRLRAGAAADGTVTVLFRARRSAGEGECWGGESSIGFFRVEPGGEAGESEELDSGCGVADPDLAVDPGGAAVAVWGWRATYSGDEALYSRIDPGGSASAPQTLLDGGEGANVSGLDVARGAPGSALAVWAAEGSVHARRIPFTGSLGSTSLVAAPPAGRYFSSPRLAAGPDGSAVAVWESEIEAGRYETALQATALEADGTPHSPRTLLAPNRWDHGARVSAGPSGSFLTSWRVSVPQRNRLQAARFGTEPQESNDAFADAQPLEAELPSFASGSNAGASKEAGEPDHAGEPGGASVWFSWTATESGPVTLTTCASEGLDPALAVYTGGSLATLTAVATAAGGAPRPCSAGDAGVRFDALAGTTYRIAVDGEEKSEGAFGLKLIARDAPVNDAFGAAKQVTGSLPRYLSGSNLDASREAGEPNHAGDPGGASVWYSWTAPIGGKTTISACGSSLGQPLLGVYTGSALASLVEVGSDGTGSCGSVAFAAVAGTTYRVAVDGRDGREGRFQLRFVQTPANDDLAHAQALSGIYIPVGGSNVAASKEAGEPNHAGDPGGASVWYSWTPSSSGSIQVSACLFAGKGTSALLAVYTGNAYGDLDEVASDAGGGSTGDCYSGSSKVRFDFEAGTRYLLAIDGEGGAEAWFSLTSETVPGNDDFASAFGLSDSLHQSVSSSNRLASKEVGEPDHAGDPGGASVWYSWTPASSGTATVSICAFFAPSLALAVYTGKDLTHLTEVGSDVGGGKSGCSSPPSEVEFEAQKGTRYYVAVDGQGGAEAFFSLQLDLEPAAPNDAFAAPVNLGSESWASFQGSSSLATKEAGEPNHAGDPGGASVWFTWTAPSSGLFGISTCSSGAFDPLLAVYTGTALAALQGVAASDDDSRPPCSSKDARTRFAAVAGTTYRIAVDGKGGDSGSFNLELEQVPANDDFGSAVQLTDDLPLYKWGSNRYASRQALEPAHGGEEEGSSVWYSWTAPTDDELELSVCSFGSLRPALGLYTGSSLGSLVPVAGEASDEDDCTRLAFAASAGTTYRIAVDGRERREGGFQVELRGRPGNDDFAAAEAIGSDLPEFFSGDNRVASKEAGEPDHAGEEGGASVWFTWTAPSAGTVAISTCSFGTLDPLLAVYTGSALAGLEEVGASDDSPRSSCSQDDGEVRFAATAGTTYRIAVDGKGGTTGPFSLRLQPAAGNDAFAGAQALPADLPVSIWGSNRVASKEAGEPNHAGDPGGASVWFTWTAPSSGTVKVVTCSSQFDDLDPVLAVYTGSSLAGLTEVAASDDTDHAGCSEEDGEVRFAATAGTTYRIAVDGKGGGADEFQLQLSAAGPANDDFEDAIDVPQAAAAVAGNNAGAGAQPGERAGAEQTVWYRLLAERNEMVRLHTCSDGGAPMDLDVFTGTAVGSLTQVSTVAAATGSSCAFPPGGGSYADTPVLAFEATAGTVYWISVDRYLQISPTFEQRPAGPFELIVDPPANDLRAGAEFLPLPGGSFVRSNVGATHEAGEDDHAGQTGGASVWFSWFATADGPATIDTCGSEIDTLLAVYGQGEAQGEDGEGSAGEEYGEEPPSLPPAPAGGLASSDDSDLCGAGSTQSSLELAAQEGVEYLIAVDSKDGETGQVQLDVSFETPDTTPPETHVYIPTAINSHQLTFDVYRDEPQSTFECALDGAPFASCDLSGPDWSPLGTITGLAEGTHTLEVREVDAAGNPDPTPESREFKVDMVPPQTSFSSGPEGLTRVLAPLGLGADEPVLFFECALDGAPLSYCSTPYSLPESLPDGNHTVKAVAIDEAGNRDPSPATRSFDLDRTPPVAGIDAGPEGTVEAAAVEFEFSADEEATFLCELDGKAQGSCESPRSYSGLADAQHRFELTPTDTAGNEGETLERVFRVEARPPETTIKSGPPPRVAVSSAKLTFAGDEDLSGFECALDGEEFKECEAAHELTGLAEGPHTLQVRAVDLAGKQDPTPAEREWVVDTKAPQTVIDFGPSGLTRHRGPFGFSADEDVSRFECALDGEDFFPCFDGYFLPALPDGGHTLQVRAVDLAGNVDPTPEEATLELDTTAPKVTITSAPPPLTQSVVSIEFEVDDPDATTRCWVDEGPDVNCGSPLEVKGIEDGTHTIAVMATDPAGNQTTVRTLEFTVDEEPPDTGITSAPLFSSGPARIYFAGTADAAEYRCSLDEEPFGECSSPLELDDLSEGEHRVRVYAIDTVGNADPTPDEVTFVFDTVPPDTTITEGPEGPVHDPVVPFGFESSEDSGGFQCSMDGASFGSCGTTAHDRRPGSHLFEVRAFDGAGNLDPTPASYPFTVVNQAPVPSLQLDRTTGPGPLEVAAAIGAEDGDEDPLTYEVQFGDGTSSKGSLPHAGLSHVYEEPGVYLVRLEVGDGYEKAVATETVSVGPPEPLSARAGDDRTAVAGEPLRLDGGNSRPLHGIDGYAWSFGDGGSGSGEVVSHTYEQPGTYEAQLTVSRHGEKATDSATITVLPPAPGTAKVTVLGDGSPLAGADVFVTPAGGSRIEALTDGNGVARLHGLADGTYTLAAYKPGYLPEHGELTVAGGAGTGQVELHAGEVATATVDSHPMTLEEIEAAGIDPDDPDNQHVFQFEVHLNIKPLWSGNPDPQVHSFGGMVNRRGFIAPSCFRISDSTCRIRTATGFTYVTTYWPQGSPAPLLSSLVIPFRATFLKEFYEVSLIVNNLAPAGFDLRNGSASIEVPGGMSLAPTAKLQSLLVDVPDVPGGGSARVHWILRGDEEGEYDVAAHYGATLEPFGRSIKLDARTADPIKVWGGSALKLEVDVDETSLDGYPYKVFVKLKNVADVPVYNPSVELLKEGRVGYIEQPRQRREYAVRELAPGAVHTAGPFVIVPEPSGKVDLSHSFIRKTAGDVQLDGTIVTHPRSPKFNETPEVEARGYGDKLVLDWEPVAGAGDYQVFRTLDRQEDFPADPLSVKHLDPTRAVVYGVDPGEPAFYGISSLLDPQEMVHPLTTAAGETNREWPKLSVDPGNRCDSRDEAVTLRFDALDFELASYEMTLNGLPFGASEPLSGYSASKTVHVPFATSDEDTELEVVLRDVEGTVTRQKADLACDYVALGDSYSSGEGVPTKGTGAPDDGDFLGRSDLVPYDSDENGCHRSRVAYARLVKANTDVAVTGDRLKFAACSGAVLKDMREDGKEPRQLGYLDEGTQLVTLSIGGNDMHFADIIKACVKNQITLDPTCRNDHKAELDEGYDRVKEELPKLLREIRQRAPGARILVVAYPQIFPSFPYDPLDLFQGGFVGSGLVFPCHTFLLDNVNPWDIVWLSGMQKMAAQMIEEAVNGSGSGAEYVSMGNRFGGHDVCQEFDPWFNGPFLPPHVVYSFHPNAQGQEAMADAVLAKLSQARPETFFQIHPGEFVDRTINVFGGGSGRAAKAVFSQYWPGSDVELTLESPSGRVIGRDSDDDDVQHELGPTFETYVIENPEEGEWRMRFKGLDVAPEGERVTYEAATTTEENVPPIAQFTQSLDDARPGQQVGFDASGSSDADGTIEDYEWNFDDGTGASGQTVQHSFAAPGLYEVRLLVRDDDGAAAVFAQEKVWVRAVPVAAADHYEVDQGGVLTVGATMGLLANDSVSRAGGDPRAEAVAGATHGSLDLAVDGSFVYHPDSGFAGTDSATYRLRDAGDFTSTPATLTIEVRRPDPGSAGQTSPPPGAAVTSPPPAPPVKSNPLKCRKGFKKKKVRGKTRCVKAKKKKKQRRSKR